MTLLRPETREERFTTTGSPGYNPFDNPAVPLASVGFDTIFSRVNSDSGETVTQDTAIGVATFYRCMFLLSSVVASCPIEVYRKRDHEQIDNDLFDEANEAMSYTPFELWQLAMVYRLGWGNTFIYKKREEHDRIIDLKPLHPDFCTVKPGPDGHKVFLVKKIRPDGTPDDTARPQVFTDWEIMHVPGLGYNGLEGLSIVSLMKQSLGTAIAADRLAAKFYSQGTQLGGIIKIKAPLRSQTQAEGIKARWMQRNAGVANAGNVAVLDADSDYQSVTIPPDQLQFLESRRWQTTEIARWFGVPPHLVGDVEKSTSWGTGIEQQNLGLNTYTLSGHTTPIEQRLTREVVQTRGQFARFNLDTLMRGSTTERYQALQVASGGPWLTRNEARISENKKPLDKPEYNELLPPQGIQEMNLPEEAPAPVPGAPQAQDEPGNREQRAAEEEVFKQESEDYPPKAMGWIHHAQWKGPLTVPLSHVEPDMKWLDRVDPKHVQDFVKRVEDGHDLKPVILVKTPGDDKLQLIDGHHRYLACVEKKIPCLAYIATVDKDHGAWEKMHDYQFDNS